MLEMGDASANYFAADKGKNLLSFHKTRDDPFQRVCGISHNFFSNGFLPSSLMQLFFIKIF